VTQTNDVALASTCSQKIHCAAHGIATAMATSMAMAMRPWPWPWTHGHGTGANGHAPLMLTFLSPPEGWRAGLEWSGVVVVLRVEGVLIVLLLSLLFT